MLHSSIQHLTSFAAYYFPVSQLYALSFDSHSSSTNENNISQKAVGKKK